MLTCNSTSNQSSIQECTIHNEFYNAMSCHEMSLTHVIQPEPSTAPIPHVMSCVCIRAFQAPAIDVTHPMTIYKSRVFLGVGIYGLPPTGTQLT